MSDRDRRSHFRTTGNSVTQIGGRNNPNVTKIKPINNPNKINEIQESNNNINKAMDLFLDGSYEAAIPLLLDSAEILEGLMKQFPNDTKFPIWRNRKEEYLDFARFISAKLDEEASSPYEEEMKADRLLDAQTAAGVEVELEEDAEFRNSLSKASSLVTTEEELVNEKGLDEIAGLEGVKTFVDRNIIFAQERPELFTGKRKTQKNTLLFGPPGNGKTAVAKAIAKDINSHFMKISPADIQSKYLGESENNLKAVFHVAKKLSRDTGKPVIMFFDEVDSLTGTRGSDDNPFLASIKSQFLIEFSALENNPSVDIRVLGATNIPESIDPAFKRRFLNQIYVGLPNEEARTQLINDGINDPKIKFAPDISIPKIVKMTEGYSGADIAEGIIPRALNRPLDDLLAKKDRKKAKVRPVTMNDFRNEIKQTPKTSSNRDLQKYKQYQKDLGTEIKTNKIEPKTKKK